VNPGGNQMTEKVKQLEGLANSKDLRRLETLLAEFNIFEALGLVRQELRHSDFLAFLLNPRQNHRLGDVFLGSFLNLVLKRAAEDVFGDASLDKVDLNSVRVRREWYRIYILVVDEARQFGCRAPRGCYTAAAIPRPT
jgi:hypothetical protein